jgi:Zn-dependent protease/predicted transcriptional regulator
VRWSLKIATVSGIPVFLHSTFLVLIAFILIYDLSTRGDLSAALGTVFFVLSIFGTVVLHEFGHAFAARRYGIRTRDITLLPIGGLARLERIPDVPRQELWVALAGPAVNVVLAAAALALAVVLGADATLTLSPGTEGVLGRFIAINVWLAGFNMIPAFPMDGGRALRALLAERFEYVRATEIAASLGQALAIFFGFVGLFTNPFLVFIALFVWMGASAEASTVTVRTAIAGIPVTRAMITEFRVLDGNDPLQRAADLVLSGTQQDFPVLEYDRLVGILTRDALVKTLADQGGGTTVRAAMSREFETADAHEMLEQAFARLQQSSCPVLPVMRFGRLVGLLTAENVGEFVMIRGAMRGKRSIDGQPPRVA